MKSIAIIDYQINNLSSIFHAIKNLNYRPTIINEFDSKEYDVLVVPGTGSFNHGIKYLKEKKLEKLIYDHVQKNKIVIAICLGFQLLFNKSYENGEVNGLGILDGEVIPFNNQCERPKIGWSKVKLNKNIYSSTHINNRLQDNFFYHVHSYYVNTNDTDIVLSYSYNNEFEYISSTCKNNIYGFQFHPEKSGSNGINLLDSILKSS
tara:strand:- start:2491 stop:3108 length:618 start_codon:yes stop_codon:yes gene_type:complete